MKAAFIFFAGLLATAGAGAPPPGASAGNADGGSFPREYSTQFRLRGETLYNDRSGLTTVYVNELAATAVDSGAAVFPYGAVIVMEFARPRTDGMGQLLRDPQGQPLRGEIEHVDVMRRGAGFGAAYGESRSGEWEFASYGPAGNVLVAADGAAQCAACHLKAGANRDFVFRKRSWDVKP
jgi:hypothetical protein